MHLSLRMNYRCVTLQLGRIELLECMDGYRNVSSCKCKDDRLGSSLLNTDFHTSTLFSSFSFCSLSTRILNSCRS